MFELKYKVRVPFKKWLGVYASRSLISSLKCKRRRLLRVNSMSIKNALNDSLYTGRSLRTDFNNSFVSLTIEFQEPPIHGLD